jgi:serine/threonine-protein kinase
LPDQETQAVAAGIAAGLAHAHARGVVHRDLKPANVLFDEEGRPKLADFGIARMAVGEGTLTEAGTVLGTAAYISPEQAAGAPATPASDVYSFGVILYRMLTGRLPFESRDPMELVLMNRDLPPPPIASLRPDAPGVLESTAAAALQKDPALRPADGAALLASLGVAATAATSATTALAGDTGVTRVLPAAAPPTAVVPATPPPPPPPPGRSRLPLLAGALVLLLVAGGAAAYELTRPASSAPATTGTLPSLTLPTTSTRATTRSTRQATTTAPTTSTTQPTTSTERTTTRQTTSQRTTTSAPPTTTSAPLPTTTVPPPPTTTAPLPTTAPTTTAPATT